MARFFLSEECGYWSLNYCNKRLAQRYERETGHDGAFIQTDWDFPSLAKTLGWNMARTSKCDHSSTDGTITCECGKTASYFIEKAQDWLYRHNGDTFNDRHGIIEESYFSN